jgi:hypothetical protein
MAKPNNMSVASGGGEGRSSGGITGKGGKKVTPIYKESIPPASVKVIKPGSKPLTMPNPDTGTFRPFSEYNRMTGGGLNINKIR